ncbi:MAG: hypothetical protein HN778_03045 [Prolixibacteraceae bacterium]|jgi:hypothetical protein|nr:hypothetical protein [Prolixibacteraceae bacterium]MBT6007155.1 hypothetical protein [Prolixibacteraceae bacterium]MBT6764551.1 hypothetical protein [Prolixibacteraceae bacterium]MBT6996808.1 hypothetical protein [Prolixibacteraceae bacterium]MBT7393788.1 hypothetical protein [Prolixibacteraceae bacterium]
MKQKLKYLLILGLIIFTQSGCEKINQLTVFDLDYDSQVVIESLIGINLPFNLATPEIETNSESSFEINDTRKDLIEEVTLKQIKLEISDPIDGDFSFLESIKIYISSENLEEKLIAWNEAVDPEAGNIIILETSNDDLQEYVKNDQIALRVNAVTDKLLLTDYTIDINSIFTIDARILGI